MIEDSLGKFEKTDWASDNFPIIPIGFDSVIQIHVTDCSISSNDANDLLVPNWQY